MIPEITSDDRITLQQLMNKYDFKQIHSELLDIRDEIHHKEYTKMGQ